MMNILTSKMLWGAVSAVLYTLLVFHWGDTYGPSAQLYAAVEAELRAKNGVLTKQLEDDAVTFAAEGTTNAAKLSTYSQAVETFKNKCPLDQEQVDAIRNLIGD